MKEGRKLEDKVLDQKRLLQVLDRKVYRKYLLTYPFLLIFLGDGAFFPSLFGYNFLNGLNTCFAVLSFLFYALGLFLSIRLFLLERKERLFRKRVYLFFFLLVAAIVSFFPAILAAFTSEVTYYEDGFSVRCFPPVFLLVLLLTILEVLVAYYAFLGCFQRRLRELNRR